MTPISNKYKNRINNQKFENPKLKKKMQNNI